ncbi:MAG: serine/threonine-protein kinase [Candidatus Cryptobacteroides sp.]
MLGPSGFFQSLDDGTVNPASDELEVFHISEEGFNVLYKVCRNGRFFIYKGLKPEFIGNPLYEELLKKDFNIGFSLSHIGICQYFGMVRLPVEGNCIIMEWIDGCTLEQLIAGGSLTPSSSGRILCQICDALSYMHLKQVVHRDLKPENILVTYNGQNVKIIDFGLSDADSYGILKSPAGTLAYASPELIAGENVDGRSDIWSLGMIMKEMPGHWGHIASRCLRRERERRYGCAEDVRKAIGGNGMRRAAISFCAICLVGCVTLAGASVIMKPDTQPLPEQDVREIPDSTNAVVMEEPSAVTNENHVGKDEGQESHEDVRTDDTLLNADPIDNETLDDLFDKAAEMIL